MQSPATGCRSTGWQSRSRLAESAAGSAQRSSSRRLQDGGTQHSHETRGNVNGHRRQKTPRRQCSLMGKWGNCSPCASLGLPMCICWTTVTISKSLPHELPHALFGTCIAWKTPRVVVYKWDHTIVAVAEPLAANQVAPAYRRAIWRGARGRPPCGHQLHSQPIHDNSLSQVTCIDKTTQRDWQ